MFLEESPEQQELRAELRRYYADLLTDEVRAGLAEGGEGGNAWLQVVRQIGKDGWLGIGWPTEFGGQGRPATDQFIFFDETGRAGAPFPFVTINTVGPTIMRFGTEEQKSFFLPKILAGELNFAIGYTEPEAGTDLASLRTHAMRDGEEYVVNGAKIFTSGADMADYIWLATRTDPDAPKHKGISIICVPTSAPGFEWSIINTVGGLTTTQTFYDNVRVPVANRVGAENEGWRMITTQLNHERVGLAAWSGLAISLFEDVVAWAATTPSDEGHVVIEQPWVQMDLAKCKAELEAMWLLNWRMAVHVADGELTGAESSSIKVFGTERILEVARLLSGVVGAAGYLTPGSPGALLRGRLEATGRQAQVNTFGGGVNEVQREIVASAGLGMTKGGTVSAPQRFPELEPYPDNSEVLAALVGQVAGSPNLSPDAVNLPMIRHWVEAMDDHNPIYVSDEAARAAGYDELIAPPTMLQAWIVRGLRASNEVEAARAGTTQGAGPMDRTMQLLDAEGLTSVVATNCEQEYARPLVIGDRVLVRSVIEAISDPKRTALGTGRFLTTRLDYVAVPDADVPPEPLDPAQVQALYDAGEPVATMHFRILKFLPPDRKPPRPPRPHPALTQDNAFWFEGAREHLLLIQHCMSCGTLRHPPLPACANCGSLEWDTVESSGRGTLYSFVVVHYPQVPSFEYPLPIGLIELEEGTRVVANLGGVEREDITIGMPVQAEFVDFDPELSLPVFVPAGAGAGAAGGELMDFTFNEEQLAVSEAATGLFGGLVGPERVAAVEQTEDRIDRDLWDALAGADLLGLAVPEAEGGAGHGLLELCLLLEAQGNTVAPVPLWATLVLGALPLARFGSSAQRARWLPGVVAGDVVLTAALTGSASSPTSTPPVVAEASGDGWILEGAELSVPQAHLAARIVVPASTGDGVLLALVDPQGDGVTLERTVTTDREIHPHLRLDGVRVEADDVLAAPHAGRAVLDDLLVAATIGLCALQVGVCEAALTQTAAYLNTRQQFGRPLSTFQGTMLRAADAAIDIEAMRVTWQNAAWLYDTGRDAAQSARVAKWQASERGQRAVHATQHLHGGMGADITYPIHRYFLWGKQIELMLGGPSAQLSKLGATIAEQALAFAGVEAAQ